MVPLRKLALITFILGLWGGSAWAAIHIQGVQDKQVYADQVSFTVSSQSGYTTTATLNDQAVALDQAVLVDKANYYELSVVQESLNNGSQTSQLVRFIVRASERGSTENGLPTWTPYVNIDSASEEFSGGHLQTLLPSTYPMGLELPLAVRVVDSAEGRMGVNGSLAINDSADATLTLFRGVGSTFLPAATEPGQHTYHLQVSALSDDKSVTFESDTQWQDLSGDINSDLDVGAHARLHIHDVPGDVLTIGAGVTLSIGPGSVVLVDPDITIAVQGALVVTGTAEAPVVVTTADRTHPWGGFVLETSGASAVMDYTILTASGADKNWFDHHPNHGHHHHADQCLFYISNTAQVTLDHCALIQNSGQVGHGENGYFTLNHCLVQQALTGGQYNGGAVTGHDTAFVEFPLAGAPFVDDDNDALYLSGGAHVFTDCLFGWTLDDGIDAGDGAVGSVTVENCWFESCIHEGLALSSGPRYVTVNGVVVLNCGQAIESGYGTPYVTATNCLATGNVIGARFGDNYDWTYNGTLDVTDSLLLYNYRDIWTMALSDWSTRVNQCDLQNNWVTKANDNYPDNWLWDTQDSNSQAALIMPFEPNNAPCAVGVGLALNLAVQDKATLAEPVVVRLSRFSSQVVSVDYSLDMGEQNLARGTLTFLPGQTVQKIEGLPIPENQATLSLSNPVNAERTGITQATYVDAEDLILMLVDFGSAWQYAKGTEEPPASWAQPDFDDTAWPIGFMPIGYEAGSGYQDCLATTLSDMHNHYLSVYARHTFVVDDPNQLAELYLSVNYDDGFIVYLNGTLIAEKNPPQPAAFNQTASGSHEACCGSCDLAPIDLTDVLPLLTAGPNVIAVQAHNRSLDSSDFLIDVKLWTVKQL